MRKLATGFMALWLGSAGAGGALAAEPNEGPTMSTTDLPAAARSTFAQQAKGAPIQELRTEWLNGQLVYFGQIVQNGSGTALRVSEQGKVVFRGKTHGESKAKGAKK